ncbi:hypothetical protein [Actinomadura sp. DC4]|uniref:hypothetical protein n=1 Tax=Actinomadura sp. DC4 TaxID=3055069 RepID=UPI0025B114D6|nr:hypothetical protein [Actinomadura sp. DC4]MDN3359935.1 hypothetical protein [Actinomadura sp. DC4]
MGVDEQALAHLGQAALVTELDWGVHQLVGSPLGPMHAFPYAAWLAIAPDLFRWERPARPERDAVLSHRSAGQLHGLTGVGRSIVFTAPAGRVAPRATTIHVSSLREDEVMSVRGVPVTTPHRTILDILADFAEHAEVQRALTSAVQQDLVGLRAIHADLAAVAERYGFPATGPEFVHYFLPDVEPRSLSPRNLRDYAALVLPDEVAQVRHKVAPALDDAKSDDELGLEIAAEIVGRIRWNA